MDGDIAPLEDLVRLARDHGARLMVDEAHATGALGPGGRGSVAAAGLTGEVDVVVGTLGKALGSYGAYVCAEAEVVEYLLNSARPFIFSTAPPPPSVAAADAALELLESDPRQGRAAARQRRRPARGARRRGPRGRRLGRPRSSRSGSATPRPAMELCERALAAGVFAQGIRPPTVPEGTSRLRFTVMATHREVELRAAARVRRRRRARAGDRDRGATRPAPSPSPPRRAAMEGVFVTGTGTEVGKTVVAAAIARTLAAAGREVAVFKPAVTGLDDPGEPDHALLRRAAGSAQSDEQIAPYRYGPPASPHLAAALAGEEIDPDRLRAAAARGAARRRRARLRGGRRPARPARARLPGARPRGRPRRCPWSIAASPGLGTINHTLLTIEAARSAGLEVAMVVLTPWPDGPTRGRGVQPRDDRLAGRGEGRDAAGDRPVRPELAWPHAGRPSPSALESAGAAATASRRRLPRRRTDLASAASADRLRLARIAKRGEHGAGEGDGAGDGHRLAERVDEVLRAGVGEVGGADRALEDRAGDGDAEAAADHAEHREHAGGDAGLLDRDGVHRGAGHRRHRHRDADAEQHEAGQQVAVGRVDRDPGEAVERGGDQQQAGDDQPARAEAVGQAAGDRRDRRRSSGSRAGT